MIRGFYTAAEGMLTQQKRQQMLTNNLANANTPGYKSDQATQRSFPEQLIARLGGADPSKGNIGSLSTGVYLQETIPDFSEGTLQETKNKTDLALHAAGLPQNPQTGKTEGALFFVVQTPNGVRYTQDGHFTQNAGGTLMTAEGNPVLDANGKQIQVPSENFDVAEDGTVSVAGQRMAQIGVNYAANPNQLVKEGSGLFRMTAGGNLPSAQGNQAITYQIKQGYLQGSNVSPDDTMTDLMSTFRSFETNQKVLQVLDSTIDKSVNQVGRVNG
ncbi:flagellar hook-basal body complex protein [Terrilactibacillus sp. BCM23-1]|uniref:Flagellar hook-basal body complex protein n=1 Tax=Terrilactibacillus tamarindi TaxID=2599694 RepID=A0A6N8CQ29_9BACI|nr:flagellar hook-basal body protein [Terrilactibacillus tamarindi]MTT31035.1 flagellar hook-basal body complex protein [Terrilactibacillus tamarindi]